MEAQPENENVIIQVEDQQQQQQQINPAQEVYVDTQEMTTLKNLNEHTVLYNDTENERLIYVFDYSAEIIQTDAPNLIALNKESLMYLKAYKKWELIKHPYIFNYINEIILNSALLYIFHVITFSVYLLFLYLYISSENFVFGVIALIAGMCMGFMACAKINLRAATHSNSSKVKSGFYFSFSVLILLSYFIACLWILTSLLLSFDIYLSKKMEDFLWGVQIFVIAATWIQCLYVLKYSYFGLYILMLTKIINSFVKLIIIWITTVICFAFLFQHIMRGSNVYPWDDSKVDNIILNKSEIRSFAKVSVMMVGEFDASEIINKRELIASVILVLFEIFVIILLMNLMMSLAVDDVSELRKNAEEKLLHIKIDYCIEIITLYEFCCCFCYSFDKKQIREIMIHSKKDKYLFSKKLIYGLPKSIIKFTYDEKYISEKFIPSIENAEIEQPNDSTGEYVPVDKEEFKAYLNELPNDEGRIRKFQRFFVGLNFQFCLAKPCDCNCCKH